MFDDGFIDEVERLRPHLGMTAARALGYQQVIDYLAGLRGLDETMADVAQKTRRLARKQMGWFGRVPRMLWLQALYRRLVDIALADERTRRMFDDGFIDEVERLRPHLGMTAARALGYQQVIDYLAGLRGLDETMADVAQKTRRLARKQMGWFGRVPRMLWLQALYRRLVDIALASSDVADQGGYDPIGPHRRAPPRPSRGGSAPRSPCRARSAPACVGLAAPANSTRRTVATDCAS